MGDQECEIEVSLLQVDTQFKKARSHMESAESGEVEVEIDSTVLMQTEAEVIEASSSATKSAKSKYASFAAGSPLLAPRAQEVKAYFQRRAEQKMSQEAVHPPSVSGLHGLASLASLGSIFAPNEQVSEYIKVRAEHGTNLNQVKAPVSKLPKRKSATSLGAIGGSILAPKSQEVHAYMKRRAHQKMQRKMQQKYRTVMMVVPASGQPQAVLEDRAALKAKDEFAAAAVTVGAAAAIVVAAAR